MPPSAYSITIINALSWTKLSIYLCRRKGEREERETGSLVKSAVAHTDARQPGHKRQTEHTRQPVDPWTGGLVPAGPLRACPGEGGWRQVGWSTRRFHVHGYVRVIQHIQHLDLIQSSLPLYDGHLFDWDLLDDHKRIVPFPVAQLNHTGGRGRRTDVQESM